MCLDVLNRIILIFDMQAVVKLQEIQHIACLHLFSNDWKFLFFDFLVIFSLCACPHGAWEGGGGHKAEECQWDIVFLSGDRCATVAYYLSHSLLQNIVMVFWRSQILHPCTDAWYAESYINSYSGVWDQEGLVKTQIQLYYRVRAMNEPFTFVLYSGCHLGKAGCGQEDCVLIGLGYIHILCCCGHR